MKFKIFDRTICLALIALVVVNAVQFGIVYQVNSLSGQLDLEYSLLQSNYDGVSLLSNTQGNIMVLLAINNETSRALLNKSDLEILYPFKERIEKYKSSEIDFSVFWNEVLAYYGSKMNQLASTTKEWTWDIKHLTDKLNFWNSVQLYYNVLYTLLNTLLIILLTIKLERRRCLIGVENSAKS